MKLKHLTQESCSVCGDTTIVKEELETFRGNVSMHSSGKRREKRTFLCGQEVEFCPNFNSVVISTRSVCRNNSEYKLKLETREKARESVLSYIEALPDVDDIFKNAMKDRLNYVMM
jgi:hypothetical protein